MRVSSDSGIRIIGMIALVAFCVILGDKEIENLMQHEYSTSGTVKSV